MNRVCSTIILCASICASAQRVGVKSIGDFWAVLEYEYSDRAAQTDDGARLLTDSIAVWGTTAPSAERIAQLCQQKTERSRFLGEVELVQRNRAVFSAKLDANPSDAARLRTSIGHHNTGSYLVLLQQPNGDRGDAFLTTWRRCASDSVALNSVAASSIALYWQVAAIRDTVALPQDAVAVLVVAEGGDGGSWLQRSEVYYWAPESGTVRRLYMQSDSQSGGFRKAVHYFDRRREKNPRLAVQTSTYKVVACGPGCGAMELATRDTVYINVLQPYSR